MQHKFCVSWSEILETGYSRSDFHSSILGKFAACLSKKVIHITQLLDLCFPMLNEEHI